MDHTGNKSLQDFRVLSCEHDVFQINQIQKNQYRSLYNNYDVLV